MEISTIDPNILKAIAERVRRDAEILYLNASNILAGLHISIVLIMSVWGTKIS